MTVRRLVFYFENVVEQNSDKGYELLTRCHLNYDIGMDGWTVTTRRKVGECGRS